MQALVCCIRPPTLTRTTMVLATGWVGLKALELTRRCTTFTAVGRWGMHVGIHQHRQCLRLGVQRIPPHRTGITKGPPQFQVVSFQFLIVTSYPQAQEDGLPSSAPEPVIPTITRQIICRAQRILSLVRPVVITGFGQPLCAALTRNSQSLRRVDARATGNFFRVGTEVLRKTHKD